MKADRFSQAFCIRERFVVERLNRLHVRRAQAQHFVGIAHASFKYLFKRRLFADFRRARKIAFSHRAAEALEESHPLLARRTLHVARRAGGGIQLVNDFVLELFGCFNHERIAVGERGFQARLRGRIFSTQSVFESLERRVAGLLALMRVVIDQRAQHAVGRLVRQPRVVRHIFHGVLKC